MFINPLDIRNADNENEFRSLFFSYAEDTLNSFQDTFNAIEIEKEKEEIQIDSMSSDSIFHSFLHNHTNPVAMDDLIVSSLHHLHKTSSPPIDIPNQEQESMIETIEEESNEMMESSNKSLFMDITPSALSSVNASNDEDMDMDFEEGDDACSYSKEVIINDIEEDFYPYVEASKYETDTKPISESSEEEEVDEVDDVDDDDDDGDVMDCEILSIKEMEEVEEKRIVDTREELEVFIPAKEKEKDEAESEFDEDLKEYIPWNEKKEDKAESELEEELEEAIPSKEKMEDEDEDESELDEDLKEAIPSKEKMEDDSEDELDEEMEGTIPSKEKQKDEAESELEEELEEAIQPRVKDETESNESVIGIDVNHADMDMDMDMLLIETGYKKNKHEEYKKTFTIHKSKSTSTLQGSEYRINSQSFPDAPLLKESTMPPFSLNLKSSSKLPSFKRSPSFPQSKDRILYIPLRKPAEIPLAKENIPLAHEIHVEDEKASPKPPLEYKKTEFQSPLKSSLSNSPNLLSGDAVKFAKSMSFKSKEILRHAQSLDVLRDDSDGGDDVDSGIVTPNLPPVAQVLTSKFSKKDASDSNKVESNSQVKDAVLLIPPIKNDSNKPASIPKAINVLPLAKIINESMELEEEEIPMAMVVEDRKPSLQIVNVSTSIKESIPPSVMNTKNKMYASGRKAKVVRETVFNRRIETFISQNGLLPNADQRSRDIKAKDFHSKTVSSSFSTRKSFSSRNKSSQAELFLQKYVLNLQKANSSFNKIESFSTNTNSILLSKSCEFIVPLKDPDSEQGEEKMKFAKVGSDEFERGRWSKEKERFVRSANSSPKRVFSQNEKQIHSIKPLNLYSNRNRPVHENVVSIQQRRQWRQHEDLDHATAKGGALPLKRDWDDSFYYGLGLNWQSPFHSSQSSSSSFESLLSNSDANRFIESRTTRNNASEETTIPPFYAKVRSAEFVSSSYSPKLKASLYQTNGYRNSTTPNTTASLNGSIHSNDAQTPELKRNLTLGSPLKGILKNSPSRSQSSRFSSSLVKKNDSSSEVDTPPKFQCRSEEVNSNTRIRKSSIGMTHGVPWSSGGKPINIKEIASLEEFKNIGLEKIGNGGSKSFEKDQTREFDKQLAQVRNLWEEGGLCENERKEEKEKIENEVEKQISNAPSNNPNVNINDSNVVHKTCLTPCLDAQKSLTFRIYDKPKKSQSTSRKSVDWKQTFFGCFSPRVKE